MSSDATDKWQLCTSHFIALETKRRPLYLKTQFVPRSKHFSGYKKQSLYAVSGTSRCLFSDKYKTHKCSVGRTYSCCMLNCWCITWPVGFKRLIQSHNYFVCGYYVGKFSLKDQSAGMFKCVYLTALWVFKIVWINEHGSSVEWYWRGKKFGHSISFSSYCYSWLRPLQIWVTVFGKCRRLFLVSEFIHPKMFSYIFQH